MQTLTAQLKDGDGDYDCVGSSASRCLNVPSIVVVSIKEGKIGYCSGFVSHGYIQLLSGTHVLTK